MFTVLLALAPSSARADEGLAQFMKSEKAHYGKKPLIAVSELIIRYHFRDRRDGFYVDVGCSDYKKNSTTYDLEENFGWSGIGIDPLEYLRAGWEEFRPRSKFFAYAASDKSGETLKFYSAGGLSATELDTFNLEGWKKRLDFQPKEIEVPTITISDLLDQEGVKKIDFLSMDINGAEPIALAGFDIERFAPDLVHVEVNDADELMAYFEQHGYVRIDEYLKYETSNWYFTPRK
jgi:FkbM family methyltransferase